MLINIVFIIDILHLLENSIISIENSIIYYLSTSHNFELLCQCIINTRVNQI